VLKSGGTKRRKIVLDFGIYLVLMHDDAAETKLLYGFVLLIWRQARGEKTKIVQADDEGLVFDFLLDSGADNKSSHSGVQTFDRGCVRNRSVVT
jgi:hypothetical protein